MKELNEKELREVEGGMPLNMFFQVGPALWIQVTAMEFVAGVVDGYKEHKL